MRKFAVSFLLVLLGLCSAIGADDGTLTLEECQKFVESKAGVLLDARGAKFFAKSHLPGAVNLPINDFDKSYEVVRGKLRPDQRIVVYCSSLSCPDSGKLKARLDKLGYTRVEVFKGGLAAWWKAGLPVEKSAQGN